MTPTVTRTAARPAYAALWRHVLGPCRTGDPRRCRVCFDLYRDASAETWRTTNSETPDRG